MKNLICILTITTGLAINLQGQEVTKCDMDVLRVTNDRLAMLTENEIKNFLMAFDKSCNTNVEFSEWSNELLFDILDKHTALTLTTLEKEEISVSKEAIMTALSSPLLDKVDIKKLIEKIQKTEITERLKTDIIDNLKKSID